MNPPSPSDKVTKTYAEVEEITAALEALHFDGDAVIEAATTLVMLSPHAKAAQIARSKIWDRDAGKGIRRIEVTNPNYRQWAQDMDAVANTTVEVSGLHRFSKKDLNRESWQQNPGAQRWLKILAIHGLLKLD